MKTAATQAYNDEKDEWYITQLKTTMNFDTPPMLLVPFRHGGTCAADLWLQLVDGNPAWLLIPKVFGFPLLQVQLSSWYTALFCWSKHITLGKVMYQIHDYM